MNTLHPSTDLFLKEFQALIAKADETRTVRHIVKNNDLQRPGVDHTVAYVITWDGGSSTSHATQMTTAEKIISDIKNSLLDDSVEVSFKIDNYSRDDYSWYRFLSKHNLPQHDVHKLLHMLVPAGPLDKILVSIEPQYYQKIMQIHMNTSAKGFRDESAKEHVLHVVHKLLDYSKDDKTLQETLIEEALGFLQVYKKHITTDPVNQLLFFNYIREAVDFKHWEKFLPYFKLVNKAGKKSGGDIFEQLGHVEYFYISVPTVKNMWPKFMLSGDVFAILHCIKDYFLQNKDNPLGITDVSGIEKEDGFDLLLKSQQPISRELIKNAFYALFEELSQLEYAEYSRLLNTPEKRNEYLPKIFLKAALQHDLPMHNHINKKKKI